MFEISIVFLKLIENFLVKNNYFRKSDISEQIDFL